MSKTSVESKQLYHIFKNIPDATRCLYTDTFACLCYLHAQGETEAVAVQKLLLDLFRQVNSDNDKKTGEVLSQVRQTLSGNERKYAMAPTLRMEFSDLF